MQGRIPWMSLVVLLGAAPGWAAETIRPISVTSAEVRTDAARPAADTPTSDEQAGRQSFLSLPSLATIQAVVNGRRLVPASR